MYSNPDQFPSVILPDERTFVHSLNWKIEKYPADGHTYVYVVCVALYEYLPVAVVKNKLSHFLASL